MKSVLYIKNTKATLLEPRIGGKSLLGDGDPSSS